MYKLFRRKYFFLYLNDVFRSIDGLCLRNDSLIVNKIDLDMVSCFQLRLLNTIRIKAGLFAL